VRTTSHPTSLVTGAPRLSLEFAEALARDLYGVAATLSPLPSERDQNFLVREPDGRNTVLKIANAGETRDFLEAQHAAMAHLIARDPSIRCQRVLPTSAADAIAECQGPDGRRHFVWRVTYLPGRTMAEVAGRAPTQLRSVGRLLGRVDAALGGFVHPATRRVMQWDLVSAPSLIASRLREIDDPERRALVERVARRAGDQLEAAWAGLRKSVAHNDANDHNVLVGPDGAADGLLDFGDMVETVTVADLAVDAAYALLDQPDPLAAIAAVARGYHETFPLDSAECEAVFDLVTLRLCLSVVISATQRRLDPGNDYLAVSERPAWRALARLDTIDAARARATIRSACEMHPSATTPMTAADIAAARRRSFGRGLSLHYDEPLHLVRGWMQYLYDAEGRAYLDGVNNVCHVGHCHPAVVRAAERQMAILNTNTRYLYDSLATYVTRLVALFPDPLSVCYLVCSGSEANELALRLARAHTGGTDVIVVDHAYHGNTTTLVDLSPYKYNGPGGHGRPAWVHAVTMPDLYRGLHRDPDKAGAAYAQDVHRAVASATARGAPPAAFLSESLLGCGGHVVLPVGYLTAAYAAVRAAGGVCIADEVQVGFGRVGTHRWGFETQGVVPDIVTLGKPIGNGHPMGAVITTPAIAESFDTGMEYFNTFGGNPVSCAIGLAVLDVIEHERLQERARTVGGRLTDGLADLASEHPAIGDVRGLGLFVGVELVVDRESREPDAGLARSVVQSMRHRGILLSTEGPHHNVLKIKPPLVFSDANADTLVRELGEVLASAADRRTPS